MTNALPKLTVVITAHNEEDRLPECLAHVAFADEIIVLCDKCSDKTEQVAKAAGADADEHVSEELAGEIRDVIATSDFGFHNLPVDNYVGERLVRYGWGSSFGKSAYGGLFRAGGKHWGPQRVHPAVTFQGKKGPGLNHPVRHYVDRNISDMIKRLDSYSTARAADLRDSGNIGTFANNIRRLFSRFIRCYVGRKGYKEGGIGFLTALFAGLFPVISYIKAKYEDN